MKVMIMAGGTGGHIFPAAAVAETLEKQAFEIRWLGSERGMESTLVTMMGYQFCALPVTAWQGGGKLRKLFAPFNLLRAVIGCMRIFRREKPDVVLGFGGFASAPGGLVAVMKQVPLLLHEQNGVPGLTNRKLEKYSKTVMQAFPGTFTRDYPVVGNPVREGLCHFNAPAQRGVGQNRNLKILILGGSQGAQAINELVPEAIGLVAEKNRPELWHQTGKDKSETVQQNYQSFGIEATVVEFISDMAAAYKWADLVISRSGASTVSELAAVGVGSLLFPYPWHEDRQQYHNAQWLVERGAAKLMEQFETDAEILANEIMRLNHDRQSLILLATNAWRAGVRDSAQLIARIVNETVKGNAA